MKLTLEVLASVTIKRKKPWPGLSWIGKEKEKLFLLDKKRVSILYLSTGKTKKKISKINHLLKNVAVLHVTNDGSFLVGLLFSGDLFVWHKDSDALWNIEGFPELTLQGSHQKRFPAFSKPLLFASEKIDKILVVNGLTQIFIWESCKPHQQFNPKQNPLFGQWFTISNNSNAPVPTPDCKEATVAAIFFENSVVGNSCLCSFIFSCDDRICINSLHLTWPNSIFSSSLSSPLFEVKWFILSFPFDELGSGCSPVRHKGYLVAKYSHDGLILALAVNQKNSFNSRLLFISPFTEAILAADLKGCGAKNPKNSKRRYYRIADMSWTFNNSFLICITHQGSFCIFTRLGELIFISTEGCKMDLGPNYFLNLHPLIIIRTNSTTAANRELSTDQESIISSLSEETPLKQHFSITTHPLLPILVISDGYIVTCIKFPSTCHTIERVMEMLVVDSKLALASLQDEVKLTEDSLNVLDSSALNITDASAEFANLGQLSSTALEKNSEKIISKLSLWNSTEESVAESEESDYTTIQTNLFANWSNSILKAESGKILFGDPDEDLDTGSRSKNFNMLENKHVQQRLECTANHLFSAWGMAASESGIWSEKWEVLASNVCSSFGKLFAIIIGNNSGLNSHRTESSSLNPFSYSIENVLMKCLDMLMFNTLHPSMLIFGVKLTNYFAKSVVLKCQKLILQDALLDYLWLAYNLMKKAEQRLAKIYEWKLSLRTPYHFIYDLSMTNSNFYECHSLCKLSTNTFRKSKHEDIIGKNYIQKKFSRSWKYFYHLLLKKIKASLTDGNNLDNCLLLLCKFQRKLQELNLPLKTKPHYKHRGNDLYLQGNHQEALAVWDLEIQNILKEKRISRSNRRKLTRLLHAVLYCYLRSSKLKEALLLVDSLIKGSYLNLHFTQQEIQFIGFKTHFLTKLPGLQQMPVRKIMLTLGRFMAAYFLNSSLIIFPPYSAKELPSLMDELPSLSEYITLSRNSFHSLIASTNLADIWVPQVPLNLFLISGSLVEAVEYALSLGDWKVAFIISVAYDKLIYSDKGYIKKTESSKNHLRHLNPKNIMLEKLKKLVGLSITEDSAGDTSLKAKFIQEIEVYEQLARTLEDHFLTSVLCGIDSVPYLMVKLVEKLKILIKRLPLVIPQDFYLPAPPCYCPQNKEVDLSNLAIEEGKMREDIFELIQLILSVLRASRLTLICVIWYSKYLINLQENADNLDSLQNKFLTNFDMYEETENALAFLAEHENDSDLLIMLNAFRDFCILNWLLHCRDNLELEFRKLWNISYSSEINQEEKIQQIISAFSWAQELQPFCEFMSWEPELHQIIFTIVQESPHSLKVIEMFSKCFPDLTTLPSEVDFRLQNLLKQWRNVYSTTSISEDRSPDHQFEQKTKKTLSVFYLEQCQKELKRMHSLSSENVELHIFSTDKDHNLKARISEFDTAFTDFLSIFFDVTMLKYLANMSSQMQAPLVLCNGNEVVKQELVRLSNPVLSTSSPSKVNQLLNQSQKEVSIVFESSCKVDSIKAETTPVKSKPKSKKCHTRSLFRSSSLADLSRSRSTLPITVFSTCKKTKSLENIIRARNYLSDEHLHIKKKIRKSNSFSHHSDTNRLPSKQSGSVKTIRRRSSLTELVELSTTKRTLHLSKAPSDHEQDFDYRAEFQEHMNLLTWLTRWNSKTHPNNDCAFIFKDKSKAKSQMRLNLPLNLLLMSLWLIKHNFQGKSSRNQLNQSSTSLAKAHTEQQSSESTLKSKLQASTSSTVHELNLSRKGSLRETYIGEPKQRLVFRSTSEDTFESESEKSLDAISLLPDDFTEKEKTSLHVKHLKKHNAEDSNNISNSGELIIPPITSKTKNSKTKKQSLKNLPQKKNDTNIMSLGSHLYKQMDDHSSSLYLPQEKIQEKTKSTEATPSENRKTKELSLEYRDKVPKKPEKKKNTTAEDLQQRLNQEIEKKEAEYAEQLQQTVKQEVGKLIEVQQQNMVAVITALEDSLSKIQKSLPKVFKENKELTPDKESESTVSNQKAKKISSILKNPISTSCSDTEMHKRGKNADLKMRNKSGKLGISSEEKQIVFSDSNNSHKASDLVFPLKSQENIRSDANDFLKIQGSIRKASIIGNNRLHSTETHLESQCRSSKSVDDLSNKLFHEEIKHDLKEKKTHRHSHSFTNKNEHILPNNLKGFALLKVDPSYLHNTQISDSNFSEYSNTVPRFLRLPAEKEISTQNLHNIKEGKAGSKAPESDPKKDRLRGGGGKKQKKPLPLLKLTTDPCTPISEIPLTTNRKNKNGPTLIHTGLPLLQIEKEMLPQKPKKVVGCHVCDVSSHCPEHNYVQNLLKDYWLNLQHERYHAVPDADHDYHHSLIQKPQPSIQPSLARQFSREKSKDNGQKTHRLLVDNYTSSTSEENLTKMSRHKEQGELAKPPVRCSKSEVSLNQLTTDSDAEKVPTLKEPGEVPSQSQSIPKFVQPAPNFAEMHYKTVFELEKARQFLESLQSSSLKNKTTTAVQTDNHSSAPERNNNSQDEKQPSAPIVTPKDSNVKHVSEVKPSSPIQVPTLSVLEHQGNELQAKPHSSNVTPQEFEVPHTKNAPADSAKVSKEVQTTEEPKDLFSYEKLDSTLFYPPPPNQQMNNLPNETSHKTQEMKAVSSQFLSVIDLDDGEIDDILKTGNNIAIASNSNLTKLVSEDEAREAAKLSRKRRGEMDSHENQSLKIKQANINISVQESSQRLFIEEAQQQLKDIKERIKTVENLDKNLQEDFKDSKELFHQLQGLQDEVHPVDRNYYESEPQLAMAESRTLQRVNQNIALKSWLTDLKSELQLVERKYYPKTITHRTHSKDYHTTAHTDGYKSDASSSSSSSLDNFLHNIQTHQKTKVLESDALRKVSKHKKNTTRITSDISNEYYENDPFVEYVHPSVTASKAKTCVFDDSEKESEYPESSGFSVINQIADYEDLTHQVPAMRASHSRKYSESLKRNCMMQPKNPLANSVPYYDDSEKFQKCHNPESKISNQVMGMNVNSYISTEEWEGEPKEQDTTISYRGSKQSSGQTKNPSPIKSSRFHSGNDTNTPHTSNKLKEELINAKLALAQETSDQSEMLSARTPSGALSQKDRAVARKLQKDVHHKLRMQEACQLMDELISEETELLLSPEYTALASRSSRLQAGVSHSKIDNSSKNSSSMKSTPLNSAARLRASKRVNRALGIHSSLRDHPRIIEARNPTSLKDYDPTNRTKESSKFSIKESRSDDCLLDNHGSDKDVDPNSSSAANRNELGLDIIQRHQKGKNKGNTSMNFGDTYTNSGFRFDRTYTFQKTETVSTIPEVTEDDFTVNPTSEKSSNKISKRIKSKLPNNNSRFKVRMTRTAVLRKRLASAKLNPSDAGKKHKNIKTFQGTRIKTLDSALNPAVSDHVTAESMSEDRSHIQKQNKDITSDEREAKVTGSSPLNSSLTSTPSLWEVPDDIKKILYNNEEHFEISSNNDDDYTQAISTNLLLQISDANESIGDYINWDEVDKLVESFK